MAPSFVALWCFVYIFHPLICIPKYHLHSPTAYLYVLSPHLHNTLICISTHHLHTAPVSHGTKFYFPTCFICIPHPPHFHIVCLICIQPPLNHTCLPIAASFAAPLICIPKPHSCKLFLICIHTLPICMPRPLICMRLTDDDDEDDGAYHSQDDHHLGGTGRSVGGGPIWGPPPILGIPLGFGVLLGVLGCPRVTSGSPKVVWGVPRGFGVLEGHGSLRSF